MSFEQSLKFKVRGDAAQTEKKQLLKQQSGDFGSLSFNFHIRTWTKALTFTETSFSALNKRLIFKRSKLHKIKHKDWDLCGKMSSSLLPLEKSEQWHQCDCSLYMSTWLDHFGRPRLRWFPGMSVRVLFHEIHLWVSEFGKVYLFPPHEWVLHMSGYRPTKQGYKEERAEDGHSCSLLPACLYALWHLSPSTLLCGLGFHITGSLCLGLQALDWAITLAVFSFWRWQTVELPSLQNWVS